MANSLITQIWCSNGSYKLNEQHTLEFKHKDNFWNWKDDAWVDCCFVCVCVLQLFDFQGNLLLDVRNEQGCIFGGHLYTIYFWLVLENKMFVSHEDVSAYCSIFYNTALRLNICYYLLFLVVSFNWKRKGLDNDKLTLMMLVTSDTF